MIVKLGTNLTATTDTGPQCVGPCEALRVQARLTGFSGTIDVYQGDSATAMSLTKSSGALTTVTGSNEYYDLRPSEWIEVIVTRSAGTVDELILAWTEA